MRFLLLILVLFAVWYGWRMLRRQQARIAEALSRAESQLAKRDSVELEKDPVTGVYRPRDKDDGGGR